MQNWSPVEKWVYLTINPQSIEMQLQAHFGDIVSSAPNHHNKVNIATKGVKLIFVFPGHKKAIFILYQSL